MLNLLFPLNNMWFDATMTHIVHVSHVPMFNSVTSTTAYVGRTSSTYKMVLFEEEHKTKANKCIKDFGKLLCSNLWE
jgi:hypothetical protein